MRATFWRCLPLIGVVCGILSPCALGGTLLVPSQYATIQAGIDAAAPGDTVLVADGIYTGAGNKNLDFHGKAITVQSASGDPALCIIDCQQSGRGFYFHSGETAAAVVAGFTIRNGSSSSGGGVYCYSSSPTLTNCAISGNTAVTGGGVYCGYGSGPTLTNCAISGNKAFSPIVSALGGGVYCWGGSSPTLTNCTISGNTASSGSSAFCRGGGVYCNDSCSPQLINCTISGNTASTNGGGVCCYYWCSPILTNCILWGDTPQEIYVDSSPLGATYCDVQGGYAGTGNIMVDPLFVDPDGADNDPATWQDNDYRLAAGSPCIDAGNNFGVPRDSLDLDHDGCYAERTPIDLDGNWRFADDPATPDTGVGYGAIVDMGAYEYGSGPPVPGHLCFGDLNCDGRNDFDDIDPFVTALVGRTGYESEHPGCPWLNGDIDGSGNVNFDDINPFVACLVGGGCP